MKALTYADIPMAPFWLSDNKKLFYYFDPKSVE